MVDKTIKSSIPTDQSRIGDVFTYFVCEGSEVQFATFDRDNKKIQKFHIPMYILKEFVGNILREEERAKISKMSGTEYLRHITPHHHVM